MTQQFDNKENNLIYLDNAATSFPKPPEVYQAVMHAMQEIGASPGRGSYRKAMEASRLLFQARESVARLFGAADSSRIIFTHSATESLNMALQGVLASGDHVITTSMEHNSVLRPLHEMSRNGVEVTVVRADGQGHITPEDISKALKKNSRMIAVSHASNVCGIIQPIREIARIAREAGVLMLVDAAQAAGALEIDVVRDGIDLLAAAGHKGLMGPQGTGVLFVGPGIAIRPLLSGGTGSDSTELFQPQGLPEGFEAGTHNLPGIAGLKAGVEFILQQGVAAIRQKEQRLTRYIAERLAGESAISFCGPGIGEERMPVLSLSINEMDPGMLAFMLDRHYGIAVRAGLHCAPESHRSLGTFPEGTLRVSPGFFNDSNQVAIFCDAIVECIQRR